MRRLLLLLALATPAHADDLLIGMSAAFTGPSRGLGIELYRGAFACFADVNAKGGVHGRKLRLQPYDDRYDPDRALDNTRKLLHDDKAFLLFGYVGTPTVTRVLPYLKLHEKNSVYLFCPFTGAEPMRQGPFSTSVFNLRASYRDETKGLVDHLVALGRTRIAVLYQIDAYGRSGWDGVRRALAEHRLKMCGEATYPRGTRFGDSLVPQVEILQRATPDAIICVGAYAACAAFIRDARDHGLTIPIANLSFVGSENLLARLQHAGKAAGRDYTPHLITTQVVPNHRRTELAAVKLYRELMAKHQPTAPREFHDDSYDELMHGYTSFEGFLSARLVVEVLKALGPDLERKRLARVVESLDDVPLGIDQKVSFASGKRQGLSKVYFTTVEKGEFVPLKDWSRWKP